MRHRLSGTPLSSLALILGLALSGGALVSEANAQVRLSGSGIVCPRETTGPLVEAPDTEAGFIRQVEGTMAFDLNSHQVPLMTDLSFGIRTELKPGSPPLPITVVVTHPPLGPRGVTRESWPDTVLPGEENVNLFTFEEEYEKVPGRWTFGIEVDGESVVTVPFDVLPEGGRGPIEQACFNFLS